MNDILREFLLETTENLAQLVLDLVRWEQEPSDRETLARIFRTLHTVKGTAGFLGLAKLQSITHAGENLLGRLRAGDLSFHPDIATALLGVVDAIRQILQLLETTEREGDGDYTDLIRTLERLTRGSKTTEKPWSAPGPILPPAPGSLPTGLPAAPPIGPTAVVVGPARVTLSPPPPPPGRFADLAADFTGYP